VSDKVSEDLDSQYVTEMESTKTSDTLATSLNKVLKEAVNPTPVLNPALRSLLQVLLPARKPPKHMERLLNKLALP